MVFLKCVVFLSTGGRVVILGQTGDNFGAGMSGGRAFVYDPNSTFHKRANHEMVLLETLDEWSVGEDDELRSLVEEHYNETGSMTAKRILDDWRNELKKFVKVMPEDYKNALAHLDENENGFDVSSYA